MGAENLNPLDELKNLDHQVEVVTDLAALKPIFYRLDEIAKQYPSDFEVQLVVGDIKQHLVNRGTRLKAEAQAAPPTVKLNRPAATPPPVPATTAAKPSPPIPPPPVPRNDPSPPTVKLKVPPAPQAQATPVTPPPLPPSAEAPRSIPAVGPPPTGPIPPPRIQVPPKPAAELAPPPPPQPPPKQPWQDPFATGQQASVIPGPPMAPGMVGPATPENGPRETVAAGLGALAIPPVAGPPVGVPPAGMRPAQPPPSQPPRPPLNWKRPLAIGAVIGAVVSVGLIALLVNQARKRNVMKAVGGAAAVSVDVATTPPAAAIKINGDTKCNTPCKVDLAPGDYQVMAFLDGYDPATSSLTVVAGQASSVSLALTPQAQAVRIFTDLDAGKVVFDDQPPADLQGGQFVLENVAPGPHSVKITGRNAEASFAFEVAEAKPPVLTAPPTARNLIGVLISSLGNQAHVTTSSGPMKLAVNGQPEADAGPAGVDVKSFMAGSDEIVVGDGKDQRNMKETFGPAPMLTAWFKSDLNIGTLIVSTGESDARVFVNNKEYARRTQRGQVRIPAIGPVTVRVTKDGFQNEPAQTAEVKKGAEVRLEFKLKPIPTTTQLQIRGGTPGAEVLLDQYSLGTIAADGTFNYSLIPPGDHTIDLRRDQFAPKHLQRSFKAGQTIALNGPDVTLAAAVTNGTIRLTRTPADASVTYRRADETQPHEARGNQMDLPAGTYIFSARAPGFSDRTERVQIAVGETRSLDLTLPRIAVAPAAPKTGGITDFDDPAAWKKEGELWVHRGGGWVPFKLGPKGVYTFTVELLKGGNVFKGGRIRWCIQYVDAKNYQLFELDKKNFWAEIVEKGKKLERAKTQHDLDKQKAFTVQIELTGDHVVHKIQTDGQWKVLDSFAEPGRNFAEGKFGFLIQGNDEIGVSDFTFTPGK